MSGGVGAGARARANASANTNAAGSREELHLPWPILVKVMTHVFKSKYSLFRNVSITK